MVGTAKPDHGRLHVWRVGPEARAAIVSVVAGQDVTSETIRARLAPVHELTHLTVETISPR